MFRLCLAFLMMAVATFFEWTFFTTQVAERVSHSAGSDPRAQIHVQSEMIQSSNSRFGYAVFLRPIWQMALLYITVLLAILWGSSTNEKQRTTILQQERQWFEILTMKKECGTCFLFLLRNFFTGVHRTTKIGHHLDDASTCILLAAKELVGHNLDPFRVSELRGLAPRIPNVDFVI